MTPIRLVLALLAAVPAAAADAPAGAPWPAGPLREGVARIDFGLVHVDPATAARVPAALKALAARHAPGYPVARLDETSQPAKQDLPAIFWQQSFQDSWSEEELASAGRGLSPALRKKLGAKNPVTLVFLPAPAPRAVEALRASLAIAEGMARQLNAVVIDSTTWTISSAEAWAKRRERAFDGGVPDVREHVAIRWEDQGGLFRSVTQGMGKFALPDLVASGHTANDAPAIGNLLNAACQWMIENESLAAAGEIPLRLGALRAPRLRKDLLSNPGARAVGSATVTVAVATPREGDPENRLMEITFLGFPGDLTARQDALLVRLFGSFDGVVDAEHDGELLAASERARAQLPALREAFARRAPGEAFSVKVPFDAEGGGHEWMWVEVRSWEGDRIRGILNNDPFRVKHLRAGQAVTVSASEIFDYIHRFPDGREEGNETGRILLRRQGKR